MRDHFNHERAATARSNPSVGKALPWHIVTMPFHRTINEKQINPARSTLARPFRGGQVQVCLLGRNNFKSLFTQ